MKSDQTTRIDADRTSSARELEICIITPDDPWAHCPCSHCAAALEAMSDED